MVLRSFRLASLGTLCAGGVVLAACSGGKLSLGTNTTQSQLVDPSQVGGTVTACPAGYAHPNVCCQAGPSQASSCEVYPQAPFTACGDGFSTFPDPRSCCPLDGSGACEVPPPAPSPAPDGGTGGGSGCVYACPPGWYAPSGATDGECCQTGANGTTTCSAPASMGTACGGACECPACPVGPDGGSSCPPCNCPPNPPPPCPPPPPPVPTCGACPPGWQVPGGEPGLCCSEDPSGIIECFSQAVPPGTNPGGAVDAGPPVAIDASPAPAPIGCAVSNNGMCGCSAQISGHDYQVNCDPSTNLCSCTVDNGAPSKQFADNGTQCSDPTSLFASCGFPTQ